MNVVHNLHPAAKTGIQFTPKIKAAITGSQNRQKQKNFMEARPSVSKLHQQFDGIFIFTYTQFAIRRFCINITSQNSAN
jgi:hypothetical protein